MTEAITAAQRLPSGYVVAEPDPIASPDRLVSRVEQVVIEAPLAQVVARVDAMPLSARHPPAAGLPGVVDTVPLSAEAFGPVGSRHLVFLSDGANVVEQVVENRRTDAEWRFRYQVWGYTTPAAKPLRYGVGDFHYVADGQRTRLTWTYSFELKSDVFPGVLGRTLGGLLLRLAVLDGPYAKWMRTGLAAIKRQAEGRS